MSLENSVLRCLFCDRKLRFLNGDLSEFQKHVENDHEVALRKELVLAMNFLTGDEIESLSRKLVPRMERFLTEGNVGLIVKDIFGEMKIKIKKEQVDKVDKALDNKQKNDKNDKEPPPATETEDPLSITSITSITDMEEEFQDERAENEEEENDSPLDTDTYMNEDEQNDIEQYVNSKVNKHINGETSRQKEEREEEPLKSQTPETNLKVINLVDKFKTLKQCRLCFQTFASLDELTKHEIALHREHEMELSLTCITLQDLKFPCEMCPQIPGFLSENVPQQIASKDSCCFASDDPTIIYC